MPINILGTAMSAMNALNASYNKQQLDTAKAQKESSEQFQNQALNDIKANTDALNAYQGENQDYFDNMNTSLQNISEQFDPAMDGNMARMSADVNEMRKSFDVYNKILSTKKMQSKMRHEFKKQAQGGK